MSLPTSVCYKLIPALSHQGIRNGCNIYGVTMIYLLYSHEVGAINYSHACLSYLRTHYRLNDIIRLIYS